jgi:hypothetical protein
MKTYQMLGGGIVSGNNSLEVIKQIRAYSFNPCNTLTEFMKETAKACRFYSSDKVSTKSYDEFLNSLIEHGYVTELSND